MKKKKKYKSKKIRKTFPFRWKLCSECKNKFKLEWMWKARLITYTRFLCLLKHKTSLYMCKECAPTIYDAENTLPKHERVWLDRVHIALPPDPLPKAG